MRSYSIILPSFWTGETGHKLRGYRDAQMVALYLLTAPSSNMIGLYYMPLPVMAHDIGCPIEGASKGLKVLNSICFCSYNETTEWVFVHEMAQYQLGVCLTPKDKRIFQVVKLLREANKSGFSLDFYNKYAVPFNLPDTCKTWLPSDAPSKGHRRGIEGALNKVALEQEQEQEQEQDKNSSCPETQTAASHRPAESETPLLVYPTDGIPNTWNLTQSQVSEWSELFPSLNILDECRLALAWIKASPSRRKTARGMAKCLVSWFGRSQNGNITHRSQPQPPAQSQFVGPDFNLEKSMAAVRAMQARGKS